jgi:hypothetical protein
MTAFAAMLAANEWLFTKLEFVPGINWIYLPAGMRLPCILLFGNAGAIGLLLLSSLVCFFYFFPDDHLRAFMGGVLATAAPYLANRIAQQVFGLRASLSNLSPARLLACIILCSIASPLLHHIRFALQGRTENLLRGFMAMFIGDLNGTLIVVYSIKACSRCCCRQPAKRDRARRLRTATRRSSRSSRSAPPGLRRSRRPP